MWSHYSNTAGFLLANHKILLLAKTPLIPRAIPARRLFQVRHRAPVRFTASMVDDDDDCPRTATPA